MIFPRLWLCADLGHPAADTLTEGIARALSAGPAVVWLRSPAGTPVRRLLSVARALRALTRSAGAPLLVGERLDVALAVEADGVHLPGRSLGVIDARALASALGHGGFFVSAAVHDAAGMSVGADALVVSPFGAVPGKGTALGAAGLAALRALAPGAFMVALGGIHGPADVRAARAAGADAVAVRRALMESRDPAEACRALAEALTPTPGDANPSDRP